MTTPRPVPVFVLEIVPGATESVRWIDICRHEGPFLVINHEPLRDTSRWVSVERKRPFAVYHMGLRHLLSRHATLEAATASANAWIKENDR